jgi:hypothetical protein
MARMSAVLTTSVRCSTLAAAALHCVPTAASSAES